MARRTDTRQRLLDAGMLVVSTNNAIGPSDPAPILAAVAPVQVVTVKLGDGPAAEDELLFAPNTEPAEAVPAIIAELSRRGLIRA